MYTLRQVEEFIAFYKQTLERHKNAKTITDRLIAPETQRAQLNYWEGFKAGMLACQEQRAL